MGIQSHYGTPRLGVQGASEIQAHPPRTLGFRDLLLFYLVTGVSLRWIAVAAAAGPSSLLVWLGAWAGFYIPLALSVVELSSRYPAEGGLYVWSKLSFGDFAGFISAWTYWTSNLPYFPALLYFAAGNVLFIGGPKLQALGSSRMYFLVFALIGLALPTTLNVIGLNFGKWLNNVGSVGMWVPVLVVVTLGVVSWHRYGSATHFTTVSFLPSLHLKDLVFWSGLFYAFGGCEAASFMGDEIKNPRRNIPRALLLGGAVVTVAYIAGTFFVLLTLPAHDVSHLQGLIQAVMIAGPRLGLGALVPLTALLIAISNLGQSGAFLGATARLPFVAGIDRYLPAAFGRLHPRYQTPDVAIWAQSIVAAVFIFLGQAGTSVKGAYDVLVSMGVITYFIPYLFLFASMIAVQRKPAGAEVVRLPGGKRVAIAISVLGLATTTLTILISLLPPPDEPNKPLAVAKILGLTVLLIGAGVALYWRARAGAQAAGLSSTR